MALKTTRGDPGGPVRGRGAPSNLEGRYEAWRREAVDDGWSREDGALPALRTEVTPETAKSIIARNDSPDIPFDQSINPYRGCEHGCVYCLDGATPILMAGGGVKPLAEVKVGDEIYGTERRGQYRYYVRTRVLDHWRTHGPAYRLSLADGTQLVASGDHRFLTERGWRFVRPAAGAGPRPHLTLNDSLMGFGAVGPQAARSQGRARGGLGEHRRCFSLADPSPARTRDIAGQMVESRADLRVAAVASIDGERELFDITTGTGDFIANGVISHNCYARPTHAYLGLSPGLDFETRIRAKTNAAACLREELAAPGYRPSPIALGANTDPYQPAERALGITRAIIEVLAECRHPFTIVTKNALVERDIDLIAPMAAQRMAHAYVSVTNLDAELARKLEPRASAPYRRLEAIRRLTAAGIPVGVLVAPVIPFVTDRYLEEILARARDAGATSAGYILLRLPHEVAPLCADWLATHHPLKAAHVMSLVRQMRGGRDYQSGFGVRQTGTGTFAALIGKRFELACRRLGLRPRGREPLDLTRFRAPRGGPQFDLF